MSILTSKAYRNLTHLLNMKENDIFISKRGELIIQDDFVQVDNIIDLEYAIYFTYHQLLTSSDMGIFLNSELIHKLDKSIDMIFENKQFIELLEEDSFKMIIDDIDAKLESLQESYFYKSPFFTFLKNGYNTYGYFKNIMSENNKHIRKMYQITLINIKKDFQKDYYSDDSEDEVDSGDDVDSGDEVDLGDDVDSGEKKED